jgi:hypothetical protein
MMARDTVRAPIMGGDGTMSDMQSEADWQANAGGTLSGDWSDRSHWSTGIVPDVTTPVVIQDNPIAGQPWLVTATSEAAASLLLDTDLGTFEATGGLTVAGTLDQASGEFLLDAAGTASVGAFTQTGGDASWAGSVVSGGTDTVNGTVTLQNAAWADAALGIGAGLLGSTAALQSTVALAGATLSVAGALQVGGDPFGDTPDDPDGATAGGVGTLAIDNGSVVTAGTLFLFAGAVATLDSTGALDVGSVTTATAGAVTVASDGELTADIGTVGGDLVNAGSVAIVAYQDAAGSYDGYVLVTGSVRSSGTVSVGGSATLTVQGSVELAAGSLMVGAGSTLNVGAGVALDGGQLTLDGAVLNSTGVNGDGLNSDATLADGASWSTNALSIAQSNIANATLSLMNSSLSDAGALVMGYDGDPRGGPFESGTLALLGASALTAGSLQINDQSALTLAGTASAVVGTAQAVAGALVIGADATLDETGGAITGNVVDNGVLFAHSDLADGGNVSSGGIGIGGALSGGGSIEIAGEALLDVGDASGFAGTISMLSSVGVEPPFQTVLQLDTGDMPGSFFVGGVGTGTIDVRGLAYDGGALTAQAGALASQLVVSNASTSATLGVIAAGQDLSDFTFADDSHGGTFVFDAPCYVAGTGIATADGEMPVEALRAGDRVRTADGRLVPVRWVGRRRVVPARHLRPWRVAPIRIAADAIAPGVPSRDLYVSPDHAIFLGGRLVPAGRLANGATIARQDFCANILYVHVELDRHEILLANNCPAESFLDTGNRGLFAHTAGPRPLFAEIDAPDPAALAIWAARGAAPLLLSGAALDEVRARLAARAVRLGWRAAFAARPRLVADGAALAMKGFGDGVWRARVPAPVRRLVVESDVFVPAEVLADSADPRRLGLAVRALRLDGAAPAVGSGWHAAEDGVRWTDGAGEIPVPPRRRAATLEIWTLPGGPYWRAPRGRGCQFDATVYPVRTDMGQAHEWDRTG